VRDSDGVRGRPNDQRGFVHKKILGLAGKVIRTVGRSPVASFLPGGGILRGVGDFIGGIGGEGRDSPQFAPIITDRGPFQPAQPRLPESDPMRKNRSVGIAPQDRFQANGACPPEARVCAPRGMHLNKSSYFLRDGTFVEKGSRFVSNRRLNNANGRAQNKAIVRLEKGQDHAKKLLKATGWRTISKQSSREMRNAKKAVCK